MGTEEVRKLFEARLKGGIPDPPGEFHPSDLERVREERYIKRALMHQDNDPKLAADMLWDICVWRKTVGASDINESNVNMEYINEGAFFPRGRDVDGSLLLIFKSKMHVKGQKDMEELKRCIIYWFDRVERQEDSKPITLFFDMEGCGLSNMDMEFIKYLITLMKLYYPYFLHYIVIYQMPWVLSAAFKVVKSLLPAKAVSKMKFLNKETLKEIVPPEQALVCWGGKDDYLFEFVPENKIEQVTTPKKVTFAEQNDNQHSLGEFLRLNPNDTIIFKNENDEVSASFTITNMDEGPISFKIRTTSPEKFRVRPSSGILGPGASQTVNLLVNSGLQVRTMTKDRFLVVAVQVPSINITSQELTELWQKSSGNKVDEYRLKCHFPEGNFSRNGNIHDVEMEKSNPMSKTLNNLQRSYDNLNKQVAMLKYYQFLTLFFALLAVILGYLIYMEDRDSYCQRI